MLSIGSITVNSGLVLAPMAGISDLPFRTINRSFGCELAFTEMISISSLVHKNRTAFKMLSTNSADRPLGVQILGSDPDRLKKALEILSDYPCDILDFNAACPVNKVVSRGDGAWLLREPEKLQSLLTLIVKESGRPVTVKIRSGWDQTSLNAVETALRAEDAGVTAISIHGRTKVQGYGGKVDYEIIRKVKQSVKVPVIASGDAQSPDLVKTLFEETGCNGVALARGALGNPWLFRETTEHLSGATPSYRPGVGEIAKTMKDHLALNVAFHGERDGVVRFRKFFPWYTRGLSVKELKVRAFLAETQNGMLQLIDEIETLVPMEMTVHSHPTIN
jgi:tRNA-dihydrouridine synthase B